MWQASYLHSKDMAEQNYFSHTSKDGRSPWQRAADAGTSANGENIAAGRGTAEAVLEQWKASNGHCNNMMKPGFKAFAVGYFAGGSYRHYWTQMFRSSEEQPTDGSCHASHGLLEATAAVAEKSVESHGAAEALDEPPMPEPTCNPEPCEP